MSRLERAADVEDVDDAADGVAAMRVGGGGATFPLPGDEMDGSRDGAAAAALIDTALYREVDDKEEARRTRVAREQDFS